MSTIWSPDGTEPIGFVEYHQTRHGSRLSSVRTARFRDGSSDEDSAEAEIGDVLEATSLGPGPGSSQARPVPGAHPLPARRGLRPRHGSHMLAWDGAMILSSCLMDADPPRLVHGMAEHRLMELPVLGAAARRIGAVNGRRDTCEDLLRVGGAVLTFPEGVKALRRPFRERYRLLNFGHGFMHVALATGVPVIPVAVIGAEEEAPLPADPGWLARLMGTPVAPLTPTLVLPLPVRYRIHFGPPPRSRAPPRRRRSPGTWRPFAPPSRRSSATVSRRAGMSSFRVAGHSP